MILLAFLGLNIKAWLAGGGAIALSGIIVSFLRKKGLVLGVKKFTQVSAKITKELGEALIETSDTFTEANKAISEDGKLKESSVKDVIDAGKEALLEWKDVIMIIRPKK